jgi:hypothetical protein
VRRATCTIERVNEQRRYAVNADNDLCSATTGTTPAPGRHRLGLRPVSRPWRPYGVNANNDLLWYRHKDTSGKRCGRRHSRNGTGWDRVPGLWRGVLYAVKANNSWWFHHDGLATASRGTDYGPAGSALAGTSHLDSGGASLRGQRRNDLLWYRHDGSATASRSGPTAPARSPRLASSKGLCGGGVLYAVNADNDLLWFHHDGFATASRSGLPHRAQGRRGWDFSNCVRVDLRRALVARTRGAPQFCSPCVLRPRQGIDPARADYT